MPKDFSILIGGSAGKGSRKAGFLIARILSGLGYRIFIYDDYQSLIRGGHSFSRIRASEKEFLAGRRQLDFLIALDKTTLTKHLPDLDPQGALLYDRGRFRVKDKRAVGLAVEAIVKKAGGTPLMGNTAFVAGFAKMIGLNWETLQKTIKEEFKKPQTLNLKIAKAAFDRTKNLVKIKKINQRPLPLLTGNEALSLGAVKAGLDLYLAYPMTPATGILHYLSKNKDKFKLTVVQLENEVGIVNAAIGAAYGGARTMVGTSGGGFALMTEGLSLAAQNETPLVIVESQRMSPATGVPTYTGQGDLLFALSAGHGDIVRFVIAPGDAAEACFWAGKILNLSWKYQTPSILLIDKEISESTFSFDDRALGQIKKEKALLWDRKGPYQRYKITQNGVPPLAFPGQKNAVVKSNSYEHDEFGITTEDDQAVEKMQNKRLRKFQAMSEEVERLTAVNVYGHKTAKKAIIAWGSTKGPAKEAAEKLGLKMIQPVILQPFSQKQMTRALAGVEKIALVETNGLGQLGQLLGRYGIKPDRKVLKYNSRPFLPEEIERELADF